MSQTHSLLPVKCPRVDRSPITSPVVTVDPSFVYVQFKNSNGDVRFSYLSASEYGMKICDDGSTFVWYSSTSATFGEHVIAGYSLAMPYAPNSLVSGVVVNGVWPGASDGVPMTLTRLRVFEN